MSAVIDDHGHGSQDAHATHGPAKGLMRWVLTTNHKDIGTLYLWFSFAMFLLGGSFAMVIRAELFQPTDSIRAKVTNVNLGAGAPNFFLAQLGGYLVPTLDAPDAE